MGLKTEETYLKDGNSTISVVGIPEGKKRMNGPKGEKEKENLRTRVATAGFCQKLLPPLVKTHIS